MNIVEHVANVVDNIVFQPGLNTHAQSHRIARAAIIATLQHVRENWPTIAEINVPSDIEQFGARNKVEALAKAAYVSAYVDARKVLDALLQEIGAGE